LPKNRLYFNTITIQFNSIDIKENDELALDFAVVYLSLPRAVYFATL
jgi:hypothetical protein